MATKLATELESFRSIWKGGFFGADPLEPLDSLYGLWGYTSMQHATYLACIKPYINAKTRAVEIGPGRGAWTRAMAGAGEVICLDALSAEHNGFWEYVGRRENVRYFKVEDFGCGMLTDDSIDYLFSFDALCHVSFEGISAYLTNLYPKFQSGAHGFIMVADYTKYNSFVQNQSRFDVTRSLLGKGGGQLTRRLIDAYLLPLQTHARKRATWRRLNLSEDDVARPGRWYNAGGTRTCELLEKLGYEVLDPDMELDYRSPVIHFRKH
ncbi:class I SAM-dependent methyltransferase [Streptomyces sp. NPDC048420]|uniref:class I SAM-dependent methyltransferase n=1 Tax=Streptomyces sp. NPDC048420 TaxID=3155755 RepID=UPI0034180B25